MGTDVFPAFGGVLEPRSPEAPPWGLVLWILAVVMASQSRKSKILMKWLFQELVQAGTGLRTSPH